MQKIAPKCSKYVERKKSCIYCTNNCVKNGTSYGKQRYLCKACKRSFVESYDYNACQVNTDKKIKEYLKEGCGMRSIARLLKISLTTVLKKILLLAKNTSRPMIMMSKEYEMDELCTYVKFRENKIWVAYAIRKDTKEVVDFNIGRRTNNTLKPVTNTLILSNAIKVYTDKLRHYGTLLPNKIHATRRKGTNHIERKNLTLRTHLKRLSRRTICFSKSITFLSACLKIYFWG